MNKTISLITLCLAFAFSAPAQNFLSQSFINPSVRSIEVSNTLYGVTNLLSGTGTNVDGNRWTNNFGTRIMATNTVPAGQYFPLLVDHVTLYPDKMGSYMPFANTNTIPGNGSAASTWSPSTHNLFIKMVGGSGANAAVTFIFAPVCDGVNECTAAADVFSVALTATTTTPVTLITNLPTYRWMGCKGLRLRSIHNADTDASGQVYIQNVSLNGFVP
jgi:hypothetical protein